MSSRYSHLPLVLLLVSLLALALAPSADARRGAAPFSENGAGGPLESVDRYFVPAREAQALIADADARESAGEPHKFADPVAVSITPDSRGSWENLPDGGRMWRLRIDAPGATDLNLGFSHYRLPPGATLYVIAEGEDYFEGPYTYDDNEAHGELWLPVVPGAQAVVELYVPTEVKFEPELEIGQISYGFRDWFKRSAGVLRQGTCNNDVICPVGDPWRDQIQSEAVYQRSGVWACSGQMMNNTAGDFRDLFLTANHCGVTSSSAASMVVYWNFESPTCGLLSGGSLAQNQTGATHLISGSASDYTLVEMNDVPDPAFNVYYTGWDASGATPSACTAIHHPGTDEKAISFNTDPLTTTSYLQSAVPGDGTHWRVNNWEDGTTEGGSSGSGIWDPAKRLVGQLHGGYASCSSITDDWYGKLSVSFPGLKPYLDPGSSGLTIIDGAFAAPTLSYSAHAGTDDCASDPANVNGIWEPGETVTLSVDLRAGGGFTGISGTLTSSTPGVTIVDGYATWPNLSSGNTATSQAPHFTVTLDETIACYSQVSFDLVVSSNEGGPFNVAFSNAVGATFVPPGLPLSIPDASGNATSNFDIAQNVTITDLDVRVVIDHTWVGDLMVELESPIGTRITLLDRPGYTGSGYGCSNDNMDVTFDDETVYNLETHCAGSNPWYSGSASPMQALSAFDGQSTQGTWKLIVSDHAGGDTGAITNWELLSTPPLGAGTCKTCDGVTSAQVTSLGDEPTGFALAQNRPNPFGGRSEIRFSLVQAAPTTLEVFDVTGRLVSTLLDRPMTRGTHSVGWDGRDSAGSAVASGIYFYRLTSGELSEMKRMHIVR